MTWTYDPHIPTPKDAVRLAIGDTVATDPQLQNEEIVYLLSVQPNPLVAAIAACRRLAAHYARVYDSTSGPEKRNAGMVLGHYRDLAATLRDDLLRGGAGGVQLLYAGGLSRTEHESDRLDTDLTQPIFAKQPFAEPGTEPNSGHSTPATDPFFIP